MDNIKEFKVNGTAYGLNLSEIGAVIIDGGTTKELKQYIDSHSGGGGSTPSEFHVSTLDDLASISNQKAGDIAYIDSLGKTYFEYDNQWVIKQLDVPTNEEQYGWRDTWGYNETISPIIAKLSEYIYNATITLERDVKLILRDLDEWWTGARVTGYGTFSRCRGEGLNDIMEFRATIWMCEMRCYDYMIAKYDEYTTISYIWQREVQVPEVPIKVIGMKAWDNWDDYAKRNNMIIFPATLMNDTYRLSNGIFYQFLLPKDGHNEVFAEITDGDGHSVDIRKEESKRVSTGEGEIPGVHGNTLNYVCSTDAYYNIINENEVVDNDIFRIAWTAGDYDTDWEHPENVYAPICFGMPNKNYIGEEVIIEDVDVYKVYCWVNTEKYPNLSIRLKDGVDWATVRVLTGWAGNDEFKLISGSYFVHHRPKSWENIKGELRK